MTTEDSISVEQSRAALNKLLDDEIFSGSQRLREFCFYSGNATLEGRTDLDQYEIAEKVLGRDSEFNPLNDAAVRKLASQLRHKLIEYYGGPGEAEPIVISMPRRSYLLRFRRREDASPLLLSGDEPEPIVPISDPSVSALGQALRPPWQWVGVGLAIGGSPLLAWLLFNTLATGSSSVSQSANSSPIIIDTQRGDVRGRELDIAPGAVRLGPSLDDGEDATVRLRFAPEHSSQQAGVMAMVDPDNYVRLGPHHKNRALMEFGFEREGAFDGPNSAYEFDPLGQTGASRWLALRRAGNDFTAYLSSDGFVWRTFGNRLSLPKTPGDLRTAIYAFNGRSENPSTRAAFDHFGTGLSFHSRANQPFRVSEYPNWELRDSCSLPASSAIVDGVLRVGFAPEALGCTWSLTRPTPPGDWAFSALVDFDAVSGSSFGIVAAGSKANVALTRRDLNGHSLQLSQKDDNDIRIPDFAGTPPVLLRLEKRGEIIRASASRDLDTFTPLPGEVKIAALGGVRRLGVSLSIAHWTSKVGRPPAGIYWVRLEPISPGFLPRGNVP